MDFGDADRKRDFQLNTLIGLTGFAFLFGLNAWVAQKSLLAVSLLLTARFGLVSLFLMWWTGEPRYGAHGVSLSAGFIFLYLIVTGGADGTGPPSGAIRWSPSSLSYRGCGAAFIW